MSEVSINPSEQAADYFGVKALSYSGMKDLAVSPMRFWYHHINPERPAREETAAMRLGSALHCAVLESAEVFDGRYACALDPSKWPICLDTISEIRQWITDQGEKPKGTKKDDVIAQAAEIMTHRGNHVPILAQEERLFAAANEGKVILPLDDFERVRGMAAALIEQPSFSSLLESGEPERPFLVTDPEFSISLKCKTDWAHPAHTLDIKTFSSTRGHSIGRAICDAIYYEKYYLQAWLYRYIRGIHDGKKKPFIIAFVESDPPHEVRIRRFEAEGAGGANLYWTSARTEARAMMRLYAEYSECFGDAPWLDQQNIEPLEDADLRQFAY
jgi:hypothetical protein